MSEWYQAHHLSARDRAFVSTDYLTRQLIAYIGNKRRILGFLYRLFSGLAEEHSLRRFADPFAGSGAVSRLARQMGMEVYANDWEDYSFSLNRAYLTCRPEELDVLFSPWGGLAALLKELNSDGPPSERPFISRYYAPRDTEEADYRRERLFYTRENALFIDRVRENLDRLFPPETTKGMNARARDILLALLLYEAATHVNTSGVFKAFHKGFGGHGKDALGRIMAPMELEMPVLHSSEAPAGVSKLEASLFLEKTSADLCYLDPPYTVHQYGSNYHLLNTIAKWDFPPVDNELGVDGRLKRKAGIREDWTRTKSEFCSRRTAPVALRKTLSSADARYLVLSYNSEGVIPLDELLDLLAEYGRVRINSLDYLTYRGGRQSLHRKTYNTEFQIVVERSTRWGKPERFVDAGREGPAEMKRFITAHRIMALLKNTFVPARLQGRFETGSTDKELVLARREDGFSPIILKMKNDAQVAEFPTLEELLKLDAAVLEALRATLEAAACADRQEELQVYLDLLQKARDKRERDAYQRRILIILKKFTHKKYYPQWAEEIKRIRQVVDGQGGASSSAARDAHGDFELLKKGIQDLERIAGLRFNG
jgi:adenine-specific DNA-methyltransferase